MGFNGYLEKKKIAIILRKKGKSYQEIKKFYMYQKIHYPGGFVMSNYLHNREKI
jgi:hypothetical protein